MQVNNLLKVNTRRNSGTDGMITMMITMMVTMMMMMMMMMMVTMMITMMMMMMPRWRFRGLSLKLQASGKKA